MCGNRFLGILECWNKVCRQLIEARNPKQATRNPKHATRDS